MRARVLVPRQRDGDEGFLPGRLDRFRAVAGPYPSDGVEGWVAGQDEMSEAPVVKAVTSAEVRRSAGEPARGAYRVVRKQRHADRIPPS